MQTYSILAHVETSEPHPDCYRQGSFHLRLTPEQSEFLAGLQAFYGVRDQRDYSATDAVKLLLDALRTAPRTQEGEQFEVKVGPLPAADSLLEKILDERVDAPSASAEEPADQVADELPSAFAKPARKGRK